jgi:S-adenosylmethionine hydrolase
MQRARLSPPIITLTTDFGTSDHYVGTMKGVILSYSMDAKIVDISHGIPPFSIYAGAYAIDQAAPFFPPGTIHVVVVDPGVGTSRKPLLVETSEQIFIAPDNGVLSLVIGRATNPDEVRVREISARRLWLESPSSTFHGRDIFAPVAAALARGSASPEEVGPLLERMELLPDFSPQQIEPRSWRGRVLSVDHFGNVISNFSVDAFSDLIKESFLIEVNGNRVTHFQPTFGSALAGECFAYLGSSGFIELGINQRSAAAFLGVVPGDFLQFQTWKIPIA